ncbi:MAG: class I SAM-dependent methyltransferase [Prevotellaceae bacterium]|jgi:ubiquinone/menaquinone biosynthesis C-methylase UbiE|nr:class I SAM-dependent methyltransferase [Prevotellaceae bacterium]
MQLQEKKSYDAHQHWLEKRFEKNQIIEQLKEIYATIKKLDTNPVYAHLLPLLQKKDTWLTMGDSYGTDATRIAPLCKEALPADIGVAFLEIAQKEGFIKAYSQQNAEKMTFEDNTFDFFLCRETYHHFPRPYIAVYEMLRCAKKGIVISEPLDPIFKMPFLLFLCNILDTKKMPLRSRKFWKNRFSFEIVGNYVYKVSQREFEKIAMGIGLPAVAFYYFNGVEKNNIKSVLRNILTKLRIIPYQRLVAVLFKELPDEKTKENLRKKGYYYYELPQNPYLNDVQAD